MLDPAEARAAEALVLGRAGRLTPGGLRAAVARAVMQVAPEKARRRREAAARDARVERWAEDSGNAALMGRELPPAEVLAADQRITAWARQLRKAGLEGNMDVLRARAYLDLLLGTDSGPARTPRGRRRRQARQAAAGPGGPGRPGGTAPAPGRRTVNGPIPAGFAARANLTVPLTTVLGLAGRPGEIPGIGPVDPALARDLAAAAARQPPVHLVRDGDRQPRARDRPRLRPARTRAPEPRARRGNRARRTDATHPRSGTPAPGFSFTQTGQPGPPGGFGTWTAAHPRRRAGPARHPRPDHHRGLRPPVRGPGP